MSSNTAAGSEHSSQPPCPKSSVHSPPPQDEEAGSALAALSPSPATVAHPTGGPIIAVDLDDVLCQTNAYIADWHNRNYGSKMSLDDFHYYHYWKNPYWGTPDETNEKVKKFYEGGEILKAEPVPGALEGVTNLRELGYRLIIVTARMRKLLETSWKWLEEHFPGVFESVICIGQFEEISEDEGHEIVTKLTKAEVCRSLPATLLIDDSLDNALSPQQPHTHKPIPVLLFGTYPWNVRPSNVSSPRDYLSYDQRTEQEGNREWWHDEDANLDEINRKWERDGGGKIWRVRDWGEVVKWVQENRP
ncbi:hypothetical protein GLOTRDRAFT_69266 [Gloeophyllum trabeum ATCC 11539]|uniref:HAD-like protein n=1 Tax=Gloeophyllum trabeum (strain ATCC 11539 / FP-39264 / Madison 617) TaxID=670483 RepID=S7S560_GLOTA|nr:uncharacterized protein GLOTRDRAFT_69266 [Gloeophyllum trabeum ATCC 11539]EPQ61079.1 hypothetical protein GLOTRDRAFT_69266 [Gloeophyllum trabeum ATCC 11539]